MIEFLIIKLEIINLRIDFWYVRKKILDQFYQNFSCSMIKIKCRKILFMNHKKFWSFRLEISILNYELFNFRSSKVSFCDALINPAIPDSESSSATLAIVLIPISLKQVPIDTFVLPSNVLLFIDLHFYCQNKLFSRIQTRWIRRNFEHTQPGILSKSLYIGRLMNARRCLI